MMTPRVLMVASRYSPAVGGVEYHVERVSQALVDSGWSVTVLTSSHTQGLPSEDVLNGVSIRRLPLGFSEQPLRAQFWILRRVSCFLDYDIIHFHDPYPLFAWGLPILLAGRGKRIYATFHGFESDPIKSHWRFLRNLARRAVQGCLCVGDFIEKRYGITCDRVVLGGTEERQSPPEARNHAVFVGRLEKDTGILEHIRALGILYRDFGVELPLVICGGGTLERKIPPMAEEEGIDVIMKGVVDDPTEHIRGARVCLAAGYLVMLDSMSLGVPVIGIAQSPLKMAYLKSMREAGAPISIQTTPRGVAKEIDRLLSSPTLADRVVNRGQHFARQRTWNSVVDDYFQLWQK